MFLNMRFYRLPFVECIYIYQRPEEINDCFVFDLTTANPTVVDHNFINLTIIVLTTQSSYPTFSLLNMLTVANNGELFHSKLNKTSKQQMFIESL